MVGFNLLARATALAAITTAAPFSTAITTATAAPPSSTAAASTTLPSYQNANFSDGNIISFINTDATPRTIVATSNNDDAAIPNVNLSPHQTHHQRIPNNWCGNFFSINQGHDIIPGILAEVCFSGKQQLTYFDVSSIVNASDTEGVKMLMPAVSKTPVQGCISFEESCESSYLWSDDDKNTVATEEKQLLCFVGNGLTTVPTGAGLGPVSITPIGSSGVGGLSTPLPVASTAPAGTSFPSGGSGTATMLTAASPEPVSITPITSSSSSSSRIGSLSTPLPVATAPSLPTPLPGTSPDTSSSPSPNTNPASPTSPSDVLTITKIFIITDTVTAIFTITDTLTRTFTITAPTSKPTSSAGVTSGAARKRVWYG